MGNDASVGRLGMTWGWLAIALCLASLFASVFAGAGPTTESYAPRMWSNASLSSSGDCRLNEKSSVVHHCCADGAVCVHATVPGDSADTAERPSLTLAWSPESLPIDQATYPLLPPPKLPSST